MIKMGKKSIIMKGGGRFTGDRERTIIKTPVWLLAKMLVSLTLFVVTDGYFFQIYSLLLCGAE